METLIFLFSLKILLTLFIIVIIPLYWKTYGAQNFLWLSDVGLFMTLPALWLNSSLLFSMAIIGILPMEIIWMIDYFYRLLSGQKLLGITDYMFESRYTRFIRALSLFHIFVPIIWIGYLFKLGYDQNAFLCQTILFWIVLLSTRLFTDPENNINWAFAPQAYHWKHISSAIWLLIMFIGTPVLILYPLHLLLQMAFA